MLSFMTLRQLLLMAAASTLLVLSLAGCSAPHDLSLGESCKQWKQLAKGEWSLAREDLLAAAPKMHEAVAKQVVIHAESMPALASERAHLTDQQSNDFWNSGQRLDDLCGGL
jgi:hypothetical protein